MCWSDGKDATSSRGEGEGLLSSKKQNFWESENTGWVKCWLRKGKKTGLSSVTVSLGFWLLKDELGGEYQGRNLKGLFGGKERVRERDLPWPAAQREFHLD